MWASIRLLCAAALFAAVLSPVLSSPARAGHHRWDFSEVYSNADGLVQFVELFSLNDNEAALNNFTVTSSSGGSFTFVGNLPDTMTANTWVLIGTDAFTMVNGAPAIDYLLPDQFFDPASDLLTYAGGADTWSVSGVPTDGVNSLHRTTGVGTNTPTNYAGESGSIDLSAPAPIPTIQRWGFVLLVGVMLLVATLYHGRRREATPA